MLPKRFYYIEDMAEILGKSAAAIHGHLARGQYDAVPPPVRIGRKLAWVVEAIDEWINAKVTCAKIELEKHMKEVQAPPRKRGRPTKAEVVKRRREGEVLKTLLQNSGEEKSNVKLE
jgi:predicted DNA-binding transcriptional regulator AlpA